MMYKAVEMGVRSGIVYVEKQGAWQSTPGKAWESLEDQKKLSEDGNPEKVELQSTFIINEDKKVVGLVRVAPSVFMLEEEE